jgi:hypothetical protein
MLKGATYAAEGIADVLLTVLGEVHFASITKHGNILGGSGNDLPNVTDNFLLQLQISLRHTQLRLKTQVRMMALTYRNYPEDLDRAAKIRENIIGVRRKVGDLFNGLDNGAGGQLRVD